MLACFRLSSKYFFKNRRSKRFKLWFVIMHMKIYKMLAATFLAALKREAGVNEDLEAEETLTQNGAISNSAVDLSGNREGLVGLFYKTVRGVDKEILHNYLKKAVNENLIDTILISFYVRDCRGGKGERDIARNCFLYLAELSEENSGFEKNEELKTALQKVLHLLPEYGRWDDLIVLSKVDSMRGHIYKILRKQLRKDISYQTDGKPCSLLAKWMPTEKHKLDKELNFVEKFCQYTNISKKTYRNVLSGLRQYLDILERKMCFNDWYSIDYSQVPSCAMHKFKGLFLKHDKIRFTEWQESLAKPEQKTKVNARQLFPYEIIREYYSVKNEDKLLEAQWESLVESIRSSSNSLNNTLTVCDTSGSMESGTGNVKPIHVALGLSLILSEIMEGPYKNKVITFSNVPKYVDLTNCRYLSNKIKLLKKADWDMNTDLQAVFNLVLRTAKNHKLSNEDMPKRIMIISDMQFDQATPRNNRTNFQEIDRKYKKSGYDRPQLVFWNVNGSFNDFPVQVHDSGTVLVSGFSPIIAKYLLNGDNINSFDIVRNTLDNPRYSTLRTLMEA